LRPPSGRVVFTTMMKDHDENTTSRVGARLDRITSGAERRVADYLLRAGPRAAAMSAMEIARAVGTSDATVIRTSKTLGYSNLRELRQALAEDEETDLSTRLQATIGDSPSAHDVLAGAVQRAPRWMQAAGMEWSWRLLMEPRKMWRRYLTTNAAFVWLASREIVSRRWRRMEPRGSAP